MKTGTVELTERELEETIEALAFYRDARNDFEELDPEPAEVVEAVLTKLEACKLAKARP